MFRRTFIILVLFALSPLLVLTVVYYLYNISIASKDFDKELLARMHSVNYLISEFLEDKASDVQSWTRMSIPEVCFEYDRPEAMEVFLNELKDTYKVYTQIVTYKQDGTFFSSDTKSHDILSEIPMGEHSGENVVKSIQTISDNNYIVITSPVQNQIGDVVGYISAYIAWKKLEEMVANSGALTFAGQMVGINELFFDANLNPLNEMSRSINDHSSISGMLNNAGSVNSYMSGFTGYRMTCMESQNILTQSKLVQCARIKSDAFMASLKFVRNIAIVIAILALFIITVMSFEITKTLTAPFRKIMSVLESYKGKDLEGRQAIQKDNVDDLVEYITKLIDQLIQSEEAIRKSAHLASIGQSTAMIAHDVRKPLTGMKALLTSLPHLQDNSREIEKMIVGVDQTIDRTNAMLSEILDFSKDATSLEVGEHDPQSIITAALSDVARDKADADVAIEYDLQHKNYLVVDGNRIIRIVTNIICNAVEAMNSNGKLWLKTRDDAERMIVTIGNDGPEIKAEVLEKIFDPFFTKGKKGGTGLGLAICRKIVEMHGGNISVQSSSFATEFVIVLPAKTGRLYVKQVDLIHNLNEFKKFREEAEVREEYGDTSNIAEFMRINKVRGRASYLLIVDDEPLFRETVRRLLSATGIKDYVTVIEADSAEVGLKLFEARKFDYVIADIDLGKNRMNGYDFSHEILEKYPESYVLIHSNKRKDEMDKNIRQIESERFLGFLPKPMKTSELLQFLACKTFEAPKKSAAMQKEIERPKKKVLVVNDDDQLLIAMGIMLKAPDVEILKAANVGTAIEHFGEHKIDIVFSDINLGANAPDGFDFLKHVRSKTDKTPFYFISGYPKSDEWPQAEKLGANGYYQLPIDFNVLKEVI